MTNNLNTSVYTVGGDYDSWGAKFVADMAILNKLAGDTLTVSDVGGTVTLTAIDLQAFSLVANGASGVQVDIRWPDAISRYQYVRNDRPVGVITIRCAAGGTVVTMNPGERRLVYSDGTNCVDLTLVTIAMASVPGLMAALDAKLALAGGTMTGALTLSGAPTSPLHAVTKQYAEQYADGLIATLKGGVDAAFDTLAEIAASIGAIGVSITAINATLAAHTAALVAATAANFLANANSLFMSVSALWLAATEVVLTDAATIAVDMSTFINGKVTLAGNRTLGQPSNTKVGQTGRIRILQDATGSRTLAYHADWKFSGGTAPTLTATASREDVLYYEVLAANRIFGSLNKDIR